MIKYCTDWEKANPKQEIWLISPICVRMGKSGHSLAAIQYIPCLKSDPRDPKIIQILGNLINKSSLKYQWFVFTQDKGMINGWAKTEESARGAADRCLILNGYRLVKSHIRIMQ